MIVCASICLYLTYYFVSKPILQLISGAVARSGLPIISAESTSQRQALVQMVLVVATHMVVVGILLQFSLPENFLYTQLGRLGLQFILIPFAILVGIGEAVASIVLAEILYNLAFWYDSHFCDDTDCHKLSSRLTEASLGGWMKTIRNAIQANVFLGITLLVLQLSCEELIFRFLFPNYLPGGYWTAGILFVVMQFGGLKHPIGGTFAGIGAAVMAFAHAILLQQGASLLLLVIAHLAMFITSQMFTKDT